MLWFASLRMDRSPCAVPSSRKTSSGVRISCMSCSGFAPPSMNGFFTSLPVTGSVLLKSKYVGVVRR